MLTTKQAAAAVGMSKNGIIRAIHSGRLSATRTDTGQFEIDPAELFRVYDPASTGDHLSWEVASAETPVQSDPVSTIVDGICNEKLAMLERIIRSHEETIADLRGQLAATTALATQLSSVIAELKPPKAKAGWWARLLGTGG